MRRWRHRCVTHQGNLVAVVELQRRQERALLGRRARGIGLERGADRVHVVAEPRGLLASCVLWGVARRSVVRLRGGWLLM